VRERGQSTQSIRHVVGAEVLVVDRDPSVRGGIERLFGAGEVHVTGLEHPGGIAELLDQRFFSVVVVDLDTPYPGAGVETIAAVAAASPVSAIVVLTPRRSFDDAVLAVRAGAVDVILKAPESVGYLCERIKAAAVRSLARRQRRESLREVIEVHEALVQRLLDAERRAHELDAQLGGKSSRSPLGSQLAVLVVARDTVLVDALTAGAPKGYRFFAAQSGGEALDRASSESVNLALVSDDETDLPPNTLARSLKVAHPDAMVALLHGPRPGGTVEVVEGDRRITVVEGFTSAAVLVARLDELAEASRVRERERRFLQAFREKHYELLRRLATVKQRLEAT
jgi:DNA-binding response OmpR family regulator